MSKTTYTKTVKLYDGMSDPSEKAIEVTITNDDLSIQQDDDLWSVKFWSDRDCTSVEETMDDEPNEDAICEIVRKREKAESAWID